VSVLDVSVLEQQHIAWQLATAVIRIFEVHDKWVFHRVYLYMGDCFSGYVSSMWFLKPLFEEPCHINVISNQVA
jgi:hypothetical protein